MSKKSGPIQCRLFDFHIMDYGKGKDKYEEIKGEPKNVTSKEQYMIQMFGIDEKGESFSITVKDFKPFFYVKINMEDNVDKEKVNYKEIKDVFLENIHKLINDAKNKGEKLYNYDNYASSIISKCELRKHKTLYGFDAGTYHNFIYLEFNSKRWMNKIIHDYWYDTKNDKNSAFGRSYILKKDMKIVHTIMGDDNYNVKSFALYETKLPPLLRYFHLNKISPSGWIQLVYTDNDDIHSVEYSKKTSTCKYEYEVSCKNIKALRDKETAVPYKICSFDIEASSSHGDFPLAIKHYKKVVGEMLDHINLNKDMYKTMTFEEKCEKVRKMFYAIFATSVYSSVYNNIEKSKKKISKMRKKKELESKINEKLENQGVNEEFNYLNTLDELDSSIKLYEKRIDNLEKNYKSNFEKSKNECSFMSEVFVKKDEYKGHKYSTELLYFIDDLMRKPLTYFIRKKKKDKKNKTNKKYNRKESSDEDGDGEEEKEEDDGIHIMEKQIEGEEGSPGYEKKKKWLPYIPSKYLYEIGDKESKNKEQNLATFLNKDNDNNDKRGKKYHPRNFVYMMFCGLELNKKMAYLQKALEKNEEKEKEKSLPELEGDTITFIGSTFRKYGQTEPYLNHCIAKDDCADNLATDNKTEIELCEGEETQVLEKWSKLIRRENPDIIIGYNIFGFDWKFMVERAKELGMEYDGNSKFFQLSRLNNHKCRVQNKTMKIASGTHELQFVKIPGRIQVDLYNYFRREINLSSYKLDAVSAHFIGDGVSEISTNDDKSLLVNSKNLMGLADGNNVYFEILGHSTDNYRNSKKFEVFDVDLDKGEFKVKVDDMEKPDTNPIESNESNENLLKHCELKHKIRWCLGKDDVSPQDIFNLSNERASKEDRWIVVKYCIQDCNLVHNLFQKNDIITGFVEIASICSVPMDFIVMRGQGIKLLSLVGQKCRLADTLMKNLEKEEGEGSYEGAICLPPKKNIYLDEPSAVVDYSSLYPSSMISENISHDSKVLTKEYDLKGKLLKTEGNKEYDNMTEEGYEYVDITYDMYEWQSKKGRKKKEKVKVGTKTCRFAQFPDGKTAIMPNILKELLKARKDTRKLIKWKTVERKSGGEKVSGLLSKKDGVTSILNHLTGKVVDIPDEDVKSVNDTYSPFMKNVFDKRQLGFKVTANSLYGQCGARTSSFYEIDIAASTTATGRKLLMYGKSIIEKVYKNRICETKNHGLVLSNAEYVYGDSVTSDTPLMLRNVETGNIEFRQIDDMGNDWFDYAGFKVSDDDRWNKEQMIVSQYQIYTSNGWSNIKRVIRHKTKKDIWRVNTHTGMVDVTEDHSLLDEDRKKLKPKEAKIGCKLLHNYPSFSSNRGEEKEKTANHLRDFLSYIDSIDSKTKEEKEAFIYGFFFGDGSCGKYDCPSGLKYSWALNQKDREFCEIMKDLCEEVFGDNFKINDTIKSSGVYKIVPFGNYKQSKGSKKYVEMFRSKCYNKDKYKIIPTEYLNAEYNIRMAYLSGYYAADGAKCRRQASKNILLSNKGKIGSAMLFYMFSSLGFKVSVNTRKDKLNITSLTMTSGKQRKHPNVLKKNNIIHKDYTDYVYDIETDTGDFNTGYPLIVKNTDSVFFKFNLQDMEGNPIKGQKALEITIDLAIEAGELASKFLKPPHDLEYEKTFLPFVLLSKKRYVGMLYETDPHKGKRKSMGIVLKRRDNAPIVKDVYGGVIDILMKDKDIQKAVNFVREYLERIVDGEINMEKFIITKSLRGVYKNPDGVAHKVLAERIGERDPGNKPSVGSRVPFIYFQTDKPVKLQGDRVETPQFFRENNLTVDYEHYITNQLMKPLIQVFSLNLTEIPDYKPYLKNYHIKVANIKKKYRNDQKKLETKLTQFTDKEVEKLIFSKALRRCKNIKNKVNNIQKIFGKK